MTPLNFEIAVAKEFGAATATDQPIALHDEAAAVEFRLREIEPVWRSFDTFVFDFAGVEEISGGFAQGLIGCLVEQHGNWIHDKLRFENASVFVTMLLQIVITRGIQHHDFQPRA